jgi:hypothetical protein
MIHAADVREWRNKHYGLACNPGAAGERQLAGR